MKQIILFLALFTSLSVQAQITIEADDLGVPGDTFRMSLADTLVDFLPLETGAGQHWDYSNVSVNAQITDTLVMMSQVPQTFQFVFFGKANYGLSSSFSLPGNFFDTLSMNIGYNFYKKTNNRLSRVGQGYMIQDAPLPVLYLQPDVLYNFPLNYGDKDTSETTFLMIIPSVGGVYTDQVRTTEVDGYGTLITSLDTFDALRVRSEITRRDSIVYQGSSQVITSTIVEYKWLTKGTGVPAMQVNTQKLGPVEIVTSVRFKDKYRNSSPSAIPEYEANTLDIYPTIVKPGQQIRFTKPSNFEVEEILVFNIAGQQLLVRWDKANSTLMIPEEFEKGIYLLKAISKGKQFTARFVVSR